MVTFTLLVTSKPHFLHPGHPTGHALSTKMLVVILLAVYCDTLISSFPPSLGLLQAFLLPATLKAFSVPLYLSAPTGPVHP